MMFMHASEDFNQEILEHREAKKDETVSIDGVVDRWTNTAKENL